MFPTVDFIIMISHPYLTTSTLLHIVAYYRLYPLPPPPPPKKKYNQYLGINYKRNGIAIMKSHTGLWNYNDFSIQFDPVVMKK